MGSRQAVNTTPGRLSAIMSASAGKKQPVPQVDAPAFVMLSGRVALAHQGRLQSRRLSNYNFTKEPNRMSRTTSD
jgi:hypothetical protein